MFAWGNVCAKSLEEGVACVVLCVVKVVFSEDMADVAFPSVFVVGVGIVADVFVLQMNIGVLIRDMWLCGW